MPAITSGKVLVSGANGYIAVWVVRTLLEHGFSVRGAVRSADKGKHLTQLFAPYGEKFEIVVVPDITVEGAFDEAVKGVDAIEHTASPFHFQADDPAELLEPAIKGTVGILESARKYGTSVKRVVVTSSCAAVLNISTTPQLLSELDWNDQAVQEVEEKGREASAGAKYRTSKTLAERAAWDFVKKHKGEIGWDVSVMNPPLVVGPVIHAVSSPDALNTSARMMYEAFTKPGASAGGGCWIDVRDLALAHVRALEKEEAGGERIIITAGAFSWQDWLDAAPPSSKYLKGTPGAGKDAVHLLRYKNEKSIRILGLEYRSMEDTAAAAIKDYEERGW
ncbi:D-lactaldehyde dehydrogenase [Mycena albidolilacea]|uniref:D-lactaldehyde dehydrogenase n=1 Tax=Mycena albidolilacea TaxID=1033008 RepID=A0AAD7EVE0_9AGAR|nr:D-lactaldehyde dehydrogenase [Mycena albidolilacea]